MGEAWWIHVPDAQDLGKYVSYEMGGPDLADIKATQTSKTDEWETPAWLIREIENKFGTITLDPCATAENTKAGWFFDQEMDGLEREWFGRAFVNPPYSQAAAWVKKSYEEAAAGRCEVVLLIAARTDTRYWWDYVRRGKVFFLKGRIKFIDPTQKKNYSAPFPSAVVWFSKRLTAWPSITHWDIPKEKRV